MASTEQIRALPELPDPRPRVVTADDAVVVTGHRCAACGHTVAVEVPWCPRCRGSVAPATFGPGGRVWSSTVVRVPLPGREPPWALAYVDLDDGPRVLAHVRDPGTLLQPGTRVEVRGTTPDGDPEVMPI